MDKNESDFDEKNHLKIEIPTLQTKKPIHPWRWVNDSTGICDICETVMVFEKNLTGLVVADKFFACEKCCTNLSRNELIQWTKSKMTNPTDVRPIGLWMAKDKNKDHSVLFK